MLRNRLTTIFASLAGVCGVLHTQGVQIGHIGEADFIILAGVLSATITGWLAKDFNQTGK